MISKKELRKQILEKRNELILEERNEKSNRITKKLIRHEAYIEADVILLYASFRSEVNTVELFNTAVFNGKKIYYPKVRGEEMVFYRVETEKDFEDGYWGIREPKMEDKKMFVPKEEEKVCIIMPGVVFDKRGNRIGYGRGYYDKFLKSMEGLDCCKVGIGFECQVVDVEDFPNEEHDVRLDILVTETDFYLF